MASLSSEKSGCAQLHGILLVLLVDLFQDCPPKINHTLDIYISKK